MPANQVHVWFSQGQDVPAALPCSEVLLSPDETERANRLKSPLVRAEFIQARAFLRTTIAAYTGLLPQDIRFCYSSFGRPALDTGQNINGLDFNLSHRDGNVLLAVTQNRRVGIDLEPVRAVPEADQIVDTFFSPAEKQSYALQDPHHKPEAFIRGWICKEAYLKALGKGFHRSPAGFSVEIDPHNLPQILKDTQEPESACLFSLECFQPIENFRAALAVEGTRSKISFLQFRTSLL